MVFLGTSQFIFILSNCKFLVLNAPYRPTTLISLDNECICKIYPGVMFNLSMHSQNSK